MVDTNLLRWNLYQIILYIITLPPSFLRQRLNDPRGLGIAVTTNCIPYLAWNCADDEGKTDQ